MADVFSTLKRSAVMAAIRSRGNRNTELKLAAILRSHGLSEWHRHQPLPGCPDFIFRSERVAVFIDGCFWHGCPRHGRSPDSNQAYWLPKLKRNKEHDRRATRELRAAGWAVLRFWEHDLKDGARVVRRLSKALGRPVPSPSVLRVLPVRKRAVAATRREK